MYKRILGLAVCLTLLLALFGCNHTTPATTNAFPSLSQPPRIPTTHTTPDLTFTGFNIVSTISPTVTFSPPPSFLPSSTLHFIPPVTTTAAKSGLFVEIISVTSPVVHGYNATLKAKTLPNITCGIKVYYKSQESEAWGLHADISDDEGFVEWTWKVGTNTTPGQWRIMVTAYDTADLENSVTTETYIEVK